MPEEEIPDDEIPMTDKPETGNNQGHEDGEEEEIPDEDVPLADIPETGDSMGCILPTVLMLIISAAGITALLAIKMKEADER